MSATKFWILIVMSLAIALLVGLEVWGTKRVTALTDDISNLQNKMVRARQQEEFLRGLVQRIVMESRTDPALAALLTRNGVTVTHGPTPGAAPAPTPAPAAPVPAPAPAAKKP